MTPQACFSTASLEALANVLGDTEKGLTGSEISKFLKQSNIPDISTCTTKRVRLLDAFENFQTVNKCSNNILNFLKNVFAPALYTDNKEYYETFKSKVNKVLAFEGYVISDTGGLQKVERAESLSDVEKRVNSLREKMIERGTHPQLLYYCNKELLADNYFHSVLEANKGLFNRIRDISGVEKDAWKLVEEVFSDHNPIVIINNFQSGSEKNEHTGFCNLLKGLCKMFRNPLAHEPKVEWELSEQDALDILGIISYCHRRMDNAQRIR